MRVKQIPYQLGFAVVPRRQIVDRGRQSGRAHHDLFGTDHVGVLDHDVLYPCAKASVSDHVEQVTSVQHFFLGGHGTWGPVLNGWDPRKKRGEKKKGVYTRILRERESANNTRK